MRLSVIADNDMIALAFPIMIDNSRGFATTTLADDNQNGK
eukprot:CAMPEP_0202708846 /NCGR_PEP_ID=MMETSP1385-20130828/21006_1 /ASSEMBLY_ACC=CAM_ASM_000861 /TAXON_ID=933848 /ORGANISM="Elphidium margaritaceum" /LENGTH=39 /DNA_ID= /DNA_START= /DNA_END= /DNA_ORIENTATION=